MSSTMDYLEDTTTILPSVTTTPTMAPTMTASPTIMDMWMSQLQKDHPEISFVVPSEHDNHHIDNMMNFKRLLEKVGNTAYDTISAEHHHSGLVDSLGQPITHEQISNSAVLNMADMKTLSGWERFFAGADMNSLINYLWVGVVTSLVILTVIFVVFSCYFYRKFRQWKKCNKDIRAHLNNDMYPGTIGPCDATANAEAAYYQMSMPPPPPPCYTIATGLPTYDEALHHQQQHFAFGMKFIYPTLAAVHHQASNLMSSWEKYDVMQSKQDNKKTVAALSPSKQQDSKVAKCKSASQTNVSKSSTASDLLLPPCYDVAASMALLAPEEPCDNVCINIPVGSRHGSSTEAPSDLTDIITV